MELNDILSVSDKVVATMPPAPDVFVQIIFTIIGIAVIILLQTNNVTGKYVNKFQYWRKPSLFRINPTPYDAMSETDLEKIIDRLSRNFTILITVYGILLSFIIIQNLHLAFSRWPIIIWTGWTLAILIRSGVVALELSDVLQLADKSKKDWLIDIARQVYAYKNYFRHSLYLLVLTIAFLPSFFIPSTSNDNTVSVWAPEIAVGTIAFGIIGITLFVYWFPAKVSDFTYAGRGLQSYYLYGIILMVMASINTSSNPLYPTTVSLFGMRDTLPQLLILYLGALSLNGIVLSMVLIGAIAIYLKERLRKKSQ